MHRLVIFFSFLFFLVGVMGYILSPFLLLLSVPMFLFLFFHKKEKKSCLFLLFTGVGYLLCLLLPKGNADMTSLEGIVVYRKDTYYLLLTLKGKYYVSVKSDSPSLFSVMKIQGYSKELAFTHYESVFNFKDYLKSKGVFYEFKATRSETLFDNPISPDALKNYIFQYMDEKTKVFISALLCGDSLYSITESRTLNQLGILSALSLSGFHLSFFFHMIESFLKEKQKRYFPLFKIAILLFFLFLSNFRFSIRRILLMEIIRLTAERKKLPVSYLDRISVVAIILLLFEPYALLSGAFYYPFPLLFVRALFQGRKKEKKIVFTLSIFLFYLPFRMFQTPNFHFLTPLLNIVFIPISHGLFLLSMLLFLIPQVGVLLSMITGGLLKVLNYIGDVPFCVNTGIPTILFLVFFYSFLFLSYLFRTYHFTREMKICQLCTILTFSTSFMPDFTYHQEVTFIDVGQGDCTLVRYKNHNFLIDTGGNIKTDIAKDCLIPYFEKRKIRYLDMVIITHTDYDHNGALETLVKNFDVRNTYYHEDFLSMDKNTYSFYGLDIIDHNTFSDENKDDNNYASGVYQFTLGKKTFLIMGDAPKEIEEKIIAAEPDLSCDVIKVGHHGSNTSSSKDFLSKVSPSLAIISCGTNNSYKHPHKETLKTLSDLGIPYVRTDLKGTYTVKV